MPGGVGATVKRQLNWTTFVCRSLLNQTEVGILEIGFKPTGGKLQPIMYSVALFNGVNVSGFGSLVIGRERGEILDHFST